MARKVLFDILIGYQHKKNYVIYIFIYFVLSIPCNKTLNINREYKSCYKMTVTVIM